MSSSANDRHQKLIGIAHKYKATVQERTKNWDMIDVATLVSGRLNPANSGRALSEIITAMCDAEERLYDVSLIRMEVRSILAELDNAELTVVKKEFRKVLDLSSDGVNIARSRYEHLQTVLSGVRSINANMRGITKK